VVWRPIPRPVTWYRNAGRETSQGGDSAGVLRTAGSPGEPLSSVRPADTEKYGRVGSGQQFPSFLVA